MNPFNRKALARHIKPATIPKNHLLALDAWAALIRDGRIYTLLYSSSASAGFSVSWDGVCRTSPSAMRSAQR